jgi:exonuclease III
MKIYKLSTFFVIYLLFTYTLFSEDYSYCSRIIIDGYFDDWNEVPSIKNNSIDMQILDINQIKMSQDDDYVFFFIQFNQVINLQENNNITLYVDNDLSSSTGEQINSIGADIVWRFGLRQGDWYVNKTKYYIKHIDFEFCALPSVTSDKFEFAISKKKQFNGTNPFPSSKFKISIRTDDQGKFFPNNDIIFAITQCDQPPLPIIDLTKEDDNYLRVSCWNCLKDNIANASLEGNFIRIFKAINPDIIGLEELYNTEEGFVSSIFAKALPNETYYVKKQLYCDVVLVSKFKILDSKQINGNAAFLVDMQEKYKTNAVVIVAHLPAMQNNDSRMTEVINIVKFIKDLKDKKKWSNFEKYSPIFIIGDMNFVGNNEQLNTMLTGLYQNSGEYNDWDGTSFQEANPRLTEIPLSYTWISNGYYWPGKLDYIFYSDCVTEKKKSYVLYTPKMTNNAISKFSLNYNDSPLASDHCPITADFIVKRPNSVENLQNESIMLITNKNQIFIQGLSESVNIYIYNLLGNLVMSTNYNPGDYINLDNLNNGVYFIKIENVNSLFKIILIN